MPAHVFRAALAAALVFAHPAGAADPQTAVITARTSEEGLAVIVSLPQPTNRLEFRRTGGDRTGWRVLTPGLSLSGDVITGDTPFSQVALAVRPDAEEVDRIYPSLIKVGSGWQIYGPAFQLANMSAQLRLEPASTETSTPEQEEISGYAFLGPRRLVSAHDGVVTATGETTPTELADQLRNDFFAAARFYASALDRPSPGQTLLILTADSPGPSTFRGDVTDGGVISLRFHDEGWRDALEPLSTFVWHETFHRWEAGSARDVSTAPWLHEGGAEYAAILGAVSTGGLSEDDARTRLSAALDGCRTTLDAGTLKDPRFGRGAAPYQCGVLIQWLTDLERRAQGESVLTLWGQMLKQTPDGYGVSDFRARLRQDSLALLVIDEPSDDRWEKLRSGLTSAGVTLQNRPSDNTLMTKALFHVADQNCQGSYGFFNDPEALKLDGERCGPLSGGPTIDLVEGHDPRKEARAMFAAVQARCASNQTVRYLTRDGRTLEAPCAKALAEPAAWVIEHAPRLSLP